MGYEFLSHTADIRMRINGSDLKELFTSGVQGMASVLKEDICKTVESPVKESKVQLKSVDSTSLLIDFLSEVLTRTYVDKVIYCTIRFTHITENELEGVLYGYPAGSLDEEIKAVTYTEAKVQRTADNQWASYVVFDI